MPHPRSRRTAALGGLLALGLFLAIASSAFGASDHKTVKMQDDCDPVSFNLALPPFPGTQAACVGDGRTTFEEFGAEFGANHSVEAWTFDRDDFGLESGGAITTVNEGGEPHTFTEVGRFGGGCVPPLNASEPNLATQPGTDNPVDCGAGFVMSLVPPGGSMTMTVSGAGTHMFQCLIHPWMRSIAVVEDE